MLDIIGPLKKPKYILIAILLLAAFLRLYRLDYPKGYVFDEVYHAFTAQEYLKGNKEAWEWWTTPPPGVAYEWTHPPLAKEIMAVSMFTLRSTEGWVWRLPGALLGVLSVYIVYLLGKKLLKSENAALIAGFIFSLDGLNFVQSRIGMNDIYYLAFLLVGLLFVLNKKIVLAAVFLGLALASKWAAVYAYLLFLPLVLKERQVKQAVFLVAVALIIYLLSYAPFFLLGHSLDQFVQLQQQMWWYHTNLKATHNYTSPWWSWPLNLYPVWYFVEYQKDNMANIFTSGNPAVFWTGSVAVIFTLIEAIRKKSINLFIIGTGFLIFWLPWVLSPRIMFLYHFSPSVPFLSLALGYQLAELFKDRHGTKLALVILFLAVFCFVVLYPYLTGVFLPREFIKLFFVFNLSKNPF